MRTRCTTARTARKCRRQVVRATGALTRMPTTPAFWRRVGDSCPAMTDDPKCALCAEPVGRFRMALGVSLCDQCAGAIRDHFAEAPDVDFGEGWGDD